jgi:hypothetical protein
MAVEEATITVGIERRIACSAEETASIVRRIVVSEIASCPVERVLAIDFMNYFK